MKRSLLLFCIAAMTAPAAVGDRAHAGSGKAYAALEASASLAPSDEKGAAVPVEQVLESLRVKRGYSFIFDSRRIEGKKLALGDAEYVSPMSLARALRAVGLDLQEVTPKTFAITEAPAPEPAIATATERYDELETPIDTILVLGSAPFANAVAGSKRIFDITADDLAYLSVTSPAEAIHQLPQALASFTPSNTALYGATAGINLADLRGLAPKRTMVLVNGRRRTLTTGGNDEIGGVDLNSIAEPFLERIEVQGLPGGARYGGGAVAGTINFVTKSGLVGLEAGTHLGISERGDSEEISIHAVGGTDVEGLGNFTFGVNVTRNEGLIGADREFSATPYGFGLNGIKTSYSTGIFQPGYGGTVITDRGLIGGVVLTDGSVANFSTNESYVPNSDGSLSPFSAQLDQLYNWSAWQSVVLPNDRVLGLASFVGNLTSDWRVFAEVSAGLSATDGLLAPLPATSGRGADPLTGDAAVIPLSNPFLPQSLRDLVSANFGAAATGIIYDHRYVELGPRRGQIDRRYIDIAAGVETGDRSTGAFAITYRYSHNRVANRDEDRIDLNRLQTALDPALCAAAAGCSLVDFFGAPEISDAALDFITIPEILRVTSTEEHEIAATASTALEFSEEIEGVASAGIELRRTSLTDREFAPIGSAPIGYLGATENDGAVSTLDAYAEIQTALFRSAAFPGEVDGSLALRVTKSDQFDSAFNFEAGLDWRPVKGVSLFTRQHIGERAPDVLELFSIGSTMEMAFSDPCGLDPARQTAIVQANCASAGPLGVPAGFAQTAPLATSTFYGNPDVDSERVRTGAYGVTISPTDLLPRIPGKLQLSATWLDYEISDSIGGYADVLGACYSSESFSSPACAVNARTGSPSIVRDPVTRQIASYDSTLHNIGALKWRGLDLEFRYAVQPEAIPSLDSIWVSALHTYTDKVESTDGLGETMRLDGLIDFPRHRTLVSAGIDAGRWSLVGYANRRGRALTQQLDIPEARVPAALYLDTTLRFDVTDQAYVQASVKNITDKEPAITAFNDIGNFAPEYYDPVGRRYSLSLRLTF